MTLKEMEIVTETRSTYIQAGVPIVKGWGFFVAVDEGTGADVVTSPRME